MKEFYQKYGQAVLSFLAGSLFLKILSGVLGSFMIYALVMLMLSSGQAKFNIKEVDGKNALSNEEMGMLSVDEASGLLQQRAFLQSAMIRAKDDSIGLSIDLNKGLVSLEIKGVVLFSRPVETYHLSQSIKNLPDTLLMNLTAVPSIVMSFRSTIVKEPFIEKKAPKDTSEVQLDAFRIDTSYREPAFLIMELDNGIKLIIKQNDGLGFRDRLKYNSFIFQERMKRTGRILVALFRGRVPENIPFVSIEMKAKDIRIIYRALPQHPKISIRVK